MEWSTFRTEKREETPRFSPFKRQLLTCLASNTGGINTGIAFGFSAILIPQLQKPESDIQINLEYVSWIASVIPLLMIVGSFGGGSLIERFGRKGTHFILAVPCILGLLIIYFASSTIHLLTGRIFWGFGTGIFSTVFPVYYAEIGDRKYRGLFISITNIAVAFGIFFVHLLGTFLTWRLTALISIIFPISTIFLMILVPESPSWFVIKNRYEDALKAFKWFRGNQARGEFEIMWEQHQNFVEENSYKPHLSPAIISKPGFYKPFLIVICLFFVLQFTGSYVVAFYSIQIFQEALGSKIDEYLLMIFFDIGRLIVSIFGFYILKISKRRILMNTSGIGIGVFTFSLAALFFYPNIFKGSHIHTCFVVFLLIGYFISCIGGIVLVAWCAAGEMMPLKYRNFGTGLIVAINYLIFFISIKVAPGLMEIFGVGGIFIVFGSVALVGTFIMYFVMPETKNLTLEQIEVYFCEK